jgi:hypothetical protein
MQKKLKVSLIIVHIHNTTMSQKLTFSRPNAYAWYLGYLLKLTKQAIAQILFLNHASE